MIWWWIRCKTSNFDDASVPVNEPMILGVTCGASRRAGQQSHFKCAFMRLSCVWMHTIEIALANATAAIDGCARPVCAPCCFFFPGLLMSDMEIFASVYSSLRGTWTSPGWGHFFCSFSSRWSSFYPQHKIKNGAEYELTMTMLIKMQCVIVFVCVPPHQVDKDFSGGVSVWWSNHKFHT